MTRPTSRVEKPSNGALVSSLVLWALPAVWTAALMFGGLTALPLLIGAGESWHTTESACHYPLNPISAFVWMPALLLAGSAAFAEVVRLGGRQPGASWYRCAPRLVGLGLLLIVFAVSVSASREAKGLIEKRSVEALENLQLGMTPDQVDLAVVHTNLAIAGLDPRDCERGSLAPELCLAATSSVAARRLLEDWTGKSGVPAYCVFHREDADDASVDEVVYARTYLMTDASTDYVVRVRFKEGSVTSFEHTRRRFADGDQADVDVLARVPASEEPVREP